MKFRLIGIVVMVVAFLIGEPLVSTITASPATSQSTTKKRDAAAKKREAAAKKREAAKRKALKKRMAQKAAAARKAEKKRLAAKRKRMKDGKPLLYIYSFDLRTGEPLAATHIQAQDVTARPGKKPTINKPTDQKRARVAKGLPQGNYWIYASKIGYFPGDTIYFSHREDEDSVAVALYPETRLTFTVTDSLTSRPVSANVIVRNHEQRKIMQTTSDSLRSVLAVLLDDRLPFYTIEATAVNYFPFYDTITDPHNFAGVVMSPCEVKSFVLRDMYFATGKTQILPSSDEALHELFSLLSERKDLKIRIIGHTDDIGSDRSNQILSEGRCESVRQAMIDRGIDGERIQIEGRGERDPIMPNDSEEHRQMNRRVEIELL